MTKSEYKRKVGVLTIERVGDRILHIKLDNDAVVSLEDMAAYLKCVEEDFGGQKFANLVEFGSLSNVSREAREFAAKAESNSLTIADAFVLKSLSQRILGNFYLKIDKPVVPTKLFSDVKSARQWLDNLLLSENI